MSPGAHEQLATRIKAASIHASTVTLWLMTVREISEAFSPCMSAEHRETVREAILSGMRQQSQLDQCLAKAMAILEEGDHDG